jgi:hypothetical protein
MGGGRDFFLKRRRRWGAGLVKTTEIARRLGRHFGAVRYNSKNIKICSKNMID